MYESNMSPSEPDEYQPDGHGRSTATGSVFIFLGVMQIFVISIEAHFYILSWNICVKKQNFSLKINSSASHSTLKPKETFSVVWSASPIFFAIIVWIDVIEASRAPCAWVLYRYIIRLSSTGKSRIIHKGLTQEWCLMLNVLPLCMTSCY